MFLTAYTIFRRFSPEIINLPKSPLPSSLSSSICGSSLQPQPHFNPLILLPPLSTNIILTKTFSCGSFMLSWENYVGVRCNTNIGQKSRKLPRSKSGTQIFVDQPTTLGRDEAFFVIALSPASIFVPSICGFLTQYKDKIIRQ